MHYLCRNGREVFKNVCAATRKKYTHTQNMLTCHLALVIKCSYGVIKGSTKRFFIPTALSHYANLKSVRQCFKILDC